MDAPVAVSSAALPTLCLMRLLLQHRRPPPGGTKGSAGRLDSEEGPTFSSRPQQIHGITLDKIFAPFSTQA